MEGLKEAYEILGLPEDATREQVENRYFILMKKARSEQNRTPSNNDVNNPLDLAEINRAYNLVLGIESEKTGTIEKQSKYAHFMYYYKFHVIIGIIIILFAGYMIKEGIDKRNAEAKLPPKDLSISVFGNFYFADMDLLQQNMLKLIPDWKRIDATLTYVPVEVKSEQDMAMQQKSVLNLMTEHPELYILDAKNFASLSTQGAFKRLDQIDGWAALQVPTDKLRSGQSEEDTEPQVYGIDVTGNPVFQGIEMNGERQILAVRFSDKNWEKTFTLLLQLVQTTP